MKLLALSIALFICINVNAQTQTIKVHFLYGSKPAKGFKHIERNWFGGIKGGHVSLEIDEHVIGFEPKGEFHVFAKDKDRHSFYAFQSLRDWVKDTASKKYLTVLLPLTQEQYQELKQIHQRYRDSSPYDYAFFGFRCAASTYEILAQLDLAPNRGRHSMVLKYFYPKRLRSFMIKDARKKGCAIICYEGRTSRKWERDSKTDQKIIQELKTNQKEN